MMMMIIIIIIVASSTDNNKCAVSQTRMILRTNKTEYSPGR